MTKHPQNNPWFEYPEYHWESQHAVIIGGGIAGCQMAWHLCQQGWQVTLIERHNRLACEASGNPIGVISPKMTSQASLGEDFYSQCFDYTLSQLASLEQSGKSIDYKKSGMLQLTHNPRESKRWQALKDRNLDSNFIQLLDEENTSNMAGIELPYQSSYFPNAAWINPASFCQALCDHPHCDIIYQSEALSLKKKGKLWLVSNKNKENIAQAEVVIITSGKDLFRFEQSHFLPSMPVAGQTTSVMASDSSRQLQTIIGHEGYLTPAINQQHIFGATFERNLNNPTINPDADYKNRQQLKNYLPEFYAGLSDFNSAHIAVRMTTPDRFPYVGALPDKDAYLENYHDLHQGKQFKHYPSATYQAGLFILGGLGSRGLTTSGLCAQSLCKLLVNKAPPQSQQQKQLLHYCHPARFLIKALKRNEL